MSQKLEAFLYLDIFFAIVRFRMRNNLPILVSHFNILFDERKGKESVCDNGRKKEDSDPNEISRDLLFTTFKFKLFKHHQIIFERISRYF